MKEYLKIRDDVDLKELEKFGYQVNEFNYVKNEPYETPLCIKGVKGKNKFQHILIFIENRIIGCEKTWSYWYYPYKRIPRKYIQDLIDADFVEKVVEDEK